MLERPNAVFEELPLSRIADPGAPIVYGIVQPGPNLSVGVAFVQSRDVGGLIDVDTLQKTSEEIAAEYRRSRLQKGDILFSLRGNIGQSSLVSEDLEGANIARGIARIRVRSNFHAEYVRYALHAPEMQRRITRNANGSTFRELSIEELRKLRLPAPSFREQREIAEILRTWDEALQTCERLIAAKQSRLTAVRQRLYAATRPGACPEVANAWEETTLGAILTEVSEANPDLGPDSVITVGKYAIRRQVEHFTRSVASTNLSNYQLLRPGDFVYDPMSAYYGAVGRYSGSAPGIVSPAYAVIRLAESINPAFAEGLLKSHYIAFELENRSSQGNREGKRRILRSSEFATIPFMLPPRPEQDHIAAIVAEVALDVELAIRSRVALAKQKRGLMQKLLTGQWRVESGGSHG